MEIGKYADAGERILASRDRGRAFGAHVRDFLLDQAARKRGSDAACRFDLLEQRPGRSAKLVGQIFDRAGAGRRVGDLGEMRLFEQNELGVARDAARKAIGQAERGGKRQDRDRIGAAERGGEHGDGRAQNIHVRIALRHHAPRGLGRDESRLRRKPARGFDPRPQFSQARNFAMVRN